MEGRRQEGVKDWKTSGDEEEMSQYRPNRMSEKIG